MQGGAGATAPSCGRRHRRGRLGRATDEVKFLQFALRHVTHRAFVLAAQGNLRAETLAENFLKALPKIRRVVEKQKPPFVAKISRGGDVTVVAF